MATPTADDIRERAMRSLHEMFPDIYRLTMLSVDDWTERDRLMAQAALCEIAAYLTLDAARPAPAADGEERGA